MSWSLFFSLSAYWMESILQLIKQTTCSKLKLASQHHPIRSCLVRLDFDRFILLRQLTNSPNRPKSNHTDDPQSLAECSTLVTYLGPWMVFLFQLLNTWLPIKKSKKSKSLMCLCDWFVWLTCLLMFDWQTWIAGSKLHRMMLNPKW